MWGIDWPDLYLAWIAGLLLGVALGMVLGVIAAKVSITRIHEYSQGGSDGSTF